MAYHELWLTNDRGQRLALLDDFIFFQGTHTANTIGQCRLYLPSTFDTSLLRIDSMIQLWRAPKGGKLSLWRPFLIQRIRYEMRGDKEMIFVGGEDPNSLLKRRFVVAYKLSAESDKTDYADDMMKAYVDEAMVNSTYTPHRGTRDYTNVTCQHALSVGPEVSYEASFRNLYDTLRNIAKMARENGTDVYFDMSPSITSSTSISFQFRTFTGEIGADLSDHVVFDQARGNFRNPFYENDWSGVASFVYAGGQGEGELRHVIEVVDLARLYLSKWGWREGFEDARSSVNEQFTAYAGYRGLEKTRPILEFGGQPVDTDGCQYGRDWEFGDLVRARYREIDLKVMVDSVTLTIEKGRETIETGLRAVYMGDTDAQQGGWIPEVPE